MMSLCAVKGLLTSGSWASYANLKIKKVRYRMGYRIDFAYRDGVVDKLVCRGDTCDSIFLKLSRSQSISTSLQVSHTSLVALYERDGARRIHTPHERQRDRRVTDDDGVRRDRECQRDECDEGRADEHGWK